MMGANISYPKANKCLKTRRSKSEEHLAGQSRSGMGKFLGPWLRAHSPHLEPMSKNCNDVANGTLHSYPSLRKCQSVDCDFVMNDNISNVNDDLEKLLLTGISTESILKVSLSKGSRGLGFSVCECQGLIVLKQLFPLEVASQSGLVAEGDVILSANEQPLSGLDSFEALQVLRKCQSPVELVICRFRNVIYPTSQLSNDRKVALSTNTDVHSREVDIRIKKINGSLGFTLKKNEEGNSGHYVRALVKEPAVSDGRIRPGDRIISVNGVTIENKSHREAVKFLRDCGNDVTLKLSRDISSSLTSLASSHSEDNNRTLRKEAVEMLNDLAERKLASKKKSENETNRPTVSVAKICEDLSKLDSFSQCSSNTDLDGRLTDFGEGPTSLPTLEYARDKDDTFQNTHHSVNVTNSYKKMNFCFDSNLTLNEDGTLKAKDKGLKKWKGVVLPGDAAMKNYVCNDDQFESSQRISVQLRRSWNSRLGFSLGDDDGKTRIIRIHPDSVAADDGRLKENDQIIEINGKDVTDLQTNSIIDMLRTIRGVVSVTVCRDLLPP